MEIGNSNCATVAPSTSFMVYHNKEPGVCSSWNEGFNQIGSTHHGEAGQIPVFCEPRPVLLHPDGSEACQFHAYPRGNIMNSTNFMSYRPGLSYIAQPHFNGNFHGFRGKKPIIYQSQGTEEVIAYNVADNITENGVQSSSLQPIQFHNTLGIGGINDVGHQLQVCRGGFWGNSDHCAYTHLNSHISPSNAGVLGSGPGYNMDGWNRVNMGSGIMHPINPWTCGSPFTAFPLPQGCLQHHYPVSNVGILSQGYVRDKRYLSGDPYRSFQPQYSYHNTVLTSPTQHSTISPFAATGSTNWSCQSGKDRQSQRSHTQLSKAPALRFRTDMRKNATPPQVFQRKTKTKHSVSSFKCPPKPFSRQGQFKSSSKLVDPIYHIKWNGFDEPNQPVGQNCNLCGTDLAYAPTASESGPSNPADVAVLPCGHAFHEECLKLHVPGEQFRDPQCSLCTDSKCSFSRQ